MISPKASERRSNLQKQAGEAHKTSIIAGTLKGRPIALSKSEGVRPTQNKLRQAAFNLLLARVDIADCSALDLCCGSGAYGLEALSRGAAFCTFVDTDISTVTHNIQSLKLSAQTSVIKADATAFKPAQPADLIFADPPYQTQILSHLLARHTTLLAPHGFWLMEHEASNPPTIPATLTLLKQSTHGTKVLTLLTPVA